MQTVFHDVKAFHTHGESGFRTDVGMPPEEDTALLQALLSEEYEEMNLAISADPPDLPGYVDGLLDQIYVAVQGLLAAGLDASEIQLLWDQVQNANMSKVTGLLLEKNGGKPYRNASGKIVKPPGFQPPDIEGTLQAIRVMRDIGAK